MSDETRAWQWVQILVALAICLALGAWYISAQRDCDRRGGTLTRGALLPFACVAQPEKR